MLKAAGIDAEPLAPNVDEAMVKDALRGEGASAAEAAEALADLKAQRIAMRLGPDPLVLAADQILDLNGVWFDKPADIDHARAHLRALRGKSHELVSVAVAWRGGQRIWHHVGRAKLTMRPMTDEFIDWYLDRVGEAALWSVGAYQVEGLGAQLFSRIDGDHFTILGLPLLQVLDMLRLQGILRT